MFENDDVRIIIIIQTSSFWLIQLYKIYKKYIKM